MSAIHPHATLQEWQKGNKSLETELAKKPAGYVGARVSKKFLTDCYARGVTRGAVECVNLLTNFQPHDPLSAETVRTAPTASLVTTHAINLLNAAIKGERWPSEPTRLQLDQRDYRNKQQTIALPWWTAYGNRGKDPRVHELSAFEFMRYCDFKPAWHPVAIEDAGDSRWHAPLVAEGKKKLRTHSKAKLEAGKDYIIKESRADDDWITMGTGALVKRLRHDWIITPRNRPYVPVIYTSTNSLRQEQDQAQLLLLLFCPFTLNEEDATEFVPFICDIKTERMRAHVLSLLCSPPLGSSFFFSPSIQMLIQNKNASYSRVQKNEHQNFALNIEDAIKFPILVQRIEYPELCANNRVSKSDVTSLPKSNVKTEWRMNSNHLV